MHSEGGRARCTGPKILPHQSCFPTLRPKLTSSKVSSAFCCIQCRGKRITGRPEFQSHLAPWPIKKVNVSHVVPLSAAIPCHCWEYQRGTQIREDSHQGRGLLSQRHPFLNSHTSQLIPSQESPPSQGLSCKHSSANATAKETQEKKSKFLGPGQ